MESIKDLSLFEFDEDFKRKKEKSVDELIKDQDVLEILNRYQGDRTTVEDNWAEFLDYQEDMQKCRLCQGLNHCSKVTHGMKQYLEISDGRVIVSSIPCKYGKELLEKQDILNHILVRNVSDQLVLVTPDDIKELSATDEEVVKKIYSYILEPKRYGYIIQGQPRAGKSTLAGFLIRNLAKNGFSCGYIHFPTFLLDLKNSFGEYGNDNHIESLRKLDYLVIDDLGGENVTPWSRDEILASIITYRMQNQKPVFFTSEYSKEDLIRLYSLKAKDPRDRMKVERLINSIFTMSLPLVLKGGRIK